MAVNAGGATGGAITGAKMGSSFGPWGTAIGGVAGGLMGAFGGGGDDIELKDMRSEEQKRAAAILMQLGETGSGGGLTLGKEYGGELGAYDLEKQTQMGGKELEGLFTSPDISKARDTFTNLADTTFDPSDPKTGYAAYSRALARSGKESEDVINREGAVTGNRFGTAIAGEKVNLAMQMQDLRSQKLAQIYQASQATQLAGAQGLTGLADQMANIAGLNIGYGEMQRQIKDQKANDALTEFKRVRSEELSRIDILQTEANRNPYMGISSIPGSPSPFSQLTNSVLSSAGKKFGTQIGKDGIGSIFDFGSNSGGGSANISGLGGAQASGAGSALSEIFASFSGGA